MRKFWILAAVCVLMSPAVLASELPYTFVQGSWTSVDPPDESDSGTGPMLDVSYGLSDVFHMVGSYQDVEYDLVDSTFWEVGAGMHHTVRESFDLFGEATYVDAEFDTASDEGFAFCAGVRKSITDALEINGGVEYMDVFDEDDTLVGVNALYTMKERYAIGAGYKVGDFDTLHVGFRVSFGQR